MDQLSDKQEKQLTVKNKCVLTIAVLSAFLLVILVILEYKPPRYKEFSSDNFYVGNYGEEVDPKDAYSKMTFSDVVGTGSCRTEMTKSKDSRVCGRCTWVGEGIDIKTVDDINSFAVNGDVSMIQPYTDGAYIVAPARLTFVNSNVSQESADTIYISATINNKYLIRWDNVKSWWCHIGKDNPKKHTDVVGARGLYSICTQGYIIGQANSDTTVTLYKLNEDGSTTPVPFSELFF